MAADAIEMKGTNPISFCKSMPFFQWSVQSGLESKDGKFIDIKKCLIWKEDETCCRTINSHILTFLNRFLFWNLEYKQWNGIRYDTSISVKYKLLIRSRKLTHPFF